MTCNHCAQEFDSSVKTCPNCGRALVYGASAPPAGAEAPTADLAAPIFNPLPDPTAPAAPTLGTTMSVTGAGNIRARLRPRETGEIFSEAFRLYKANWKLYWGIVLVFYLPFALLTAAWEGYIFNPSNMSKPSIMLESAMVMSLLAYIPLFLIYFGLIRAVSDNYLGRDVRFADVIRPTTRLWGMVGACILAVLATYCAFLPLAVVMPILVFAKISLGWLAVPAIAILVLVCIMWIHWSVANSAAVIEGKGSVGSLARSVQLVRGFSWKAFFVIVGAFVIYCLVAIVAECILGAILFPLVGVHGAGLIGFGGASGFSAIAIGELIRVIAAMIGMPIVLLPLVLFYYDLRVRKEAFDLQMLAEQLGYGYQEVAPDLQHIV